MGLSTQEAEMLATLKQAYDGEAIFRPSSASRWVGPDPCIGSTQLIARVPKEIRHRSSDAAKEGTAAHAIAQSSLTGGPQPEEWVGRSIVIDDKTGETWFVDAEMGERVQGYVDMLDSRTTSGVTRYIEYKLTLADADPSNPIFAECRGTGDGILVDLIALWIEVADLKYGKGITVSARAVQLKLYALMALLKFHSGKPWKSVKNIVYQPRAYSDPELPSNTDFDPTEPKIASFDPGYLMTDFLGEVAEAMHLALAPNPSLHPSKSNCMFCPVKQAGTCPALAAAGGFAAFSRDAFDDQPHRSHVNSSLPPIPQSVLVGNPTNPRPVSSDPKVLTLRSIETYSPSEIATILDIADDYYDPWIAGIRHRAVQIAEMGTNIPGRGLKLRTGNRRFKGPPETVLAKLNELNSEWKPGVKQADFLTSPKLQTPAQIEKLLTPAARKRLDPSDKESLVERPSGGVELVRKEAADKQPIPSVTAMAPITPNVPKLDYAPSVNNPFAA
jgi:hypothetical protein